MSFTSEIQKKTDGELADGIAESLRIAIVEGENWNSWYRQMRVNVAIAYQNEQKRRQTERFIGVVEELTDVIRRKKWQPTPARRVRNEHR